MDATHHTFLLRFFVCTVILTVLKIFSIDFLHELKKFLEVKQQKFISVFNASNMPIPDTSGRKKVITLARRNQQKITSSERYEHWEDGVKIAKTIHRSYTIGSEPDYVKIYTEGLLYMRNMPADCMRLLIYLLPYVRYAEPCDSFMFNYSLTVTMDTQLRKELAQQMGCKVASLNNLLTELVDGHILDRTAKSVYRVNPHYFGKGNVKDIAEIRACYRPPAPDATFMSVYNETKRMKKLKKAGLDAKPMQDDEIGIIE